MDKDIFEAIADISGGFEGEIGCGILFRETEPSEKGGEEKSDDYFSFTYLSRIVGGDSRVKKEKSIR